ncbi:hypothetical protein CGRA01v4_08672 [Colletotrichum graminicola]|uniref:GPI anchored protein n=1 Tax=Colletotrichum graminicola (strain M1.001 / M2 / FGSC 10212) TaxID=645133 RepID=E3QJ82_COLGM|nr:uncharacterized protein GLRG_06064 [Colletotrichum graminicola M1.001]EFQ30920.1 hypothetical protein GLRG_06064 [Colletotrichum graminicola M1.001]WDK17389.1 hypothetical protein CGRA01v4_08672 [Colletotrichum graminicola]
MHYPQPFLALLSLCLFSSNVVRADDTTTTTVPIYLPHYDANSWSQLRGSVISSNDKETTYTIFCAPQIPPDCDLAVEFPFVFAEGESTLQFHGTKTSTLTADLGCTLSGTTAATCSGYSSLKSGYINGKYTGPTEVSWTSTMTGSEVQWGVLTLAQEDAAATPAPTKAPGDPDYDDFLYTGTISSARPAETNPSAASRLHLGWALTASACSMVAVTLMA